MERTFLLRLDSGAEYCDQRVRLCVCVCLSACLHAYLMYYASELHQILPD